MMTTQTRERNNTVYKENVVELPTVNTEATTVERAKAGLAKVAKGEALATEGWLEYGTGLNEGRERFPKGGQGDKDFGAWKVAQQLDGPNDMECLAAMWAAEDLERFYAIQAKYPQVRTVRGLHAKWKKPAPKQPKPKMDKDDKRKVRKLQAVIDDPAADPNVVEACKRKLDGYKTAHGEKAVDDFIEQAKEDEEDYEVMDMEPTMESIRGIILNNKYSEDWRWAQIQDWLEKAFDGDDNGMIAELNFLEENKNDWA